MFANQVLAEANKRGVTIDGVLRASDIKFENGKIYMKAGKEVIAETPVVEEVVSAKIVEQSTESDYSKRKKNVAYDILASATGKSANWLRAQLGSKSNKKGMAKRRENIENLIRSVQDEISIYRTNPEWSEFYNINNIENDELNSSYEIAMQAFYDIINNDFKDPAHAVNEYWNDYTESVKKDFEELINKIENAKTWEDADKLEKFIETIPDDILSYDKNKLDNVYANMYKRISEGENINETYSGNNAQNNETNERGVSGLNLRATQENSDTSTQGDNQNNKTGTNQEITPDTKLFQETDQTETEAFKKWLIVKLWMKAIHIFKRECTQNIIILISIIMLSFIKSYKYCTCISKLMYYDFKCLKI